MSNTNANANPTVPETNGEQPFKLDVRVRPIAPMGNLLAYANVTIGDCFKIDGFRICSGEKGAVCEYALYPGQQRKLA